MGVPLTMENPTITDRITTRPALGLTPKGRATVVLIRVRDNWEQFTPDQRAEVADLVARLSAAMRREVLVENQNLVTRRPLPLVGRISA
jgi:hypothetical protein